MSTLITIIIVLVILGLIVWAADRYLPIPQPFKNAAIFILILIACLYMLRLAGIL